MSLKNDIEVYTDEINTFPRYVGSGSITLVEGSKVGIITAATIEDVARKGDFIFLEDDGSGSPDIYRIDMIQNGHVYLEDPSPVSVSAVSFGVVPRSKYSVISWNVVEGDTAEINNVNRPVGSSDVFDNSATAGYPDTVDPIIINCGASDIVHVGWQKVR